jgi:hypothetical protein
LSEKPHEVVPTTTNYITATGKQALLLLQSAGALIPVPMIQDAIGVALKIIEICEVRKILEMLQDGSQIYYYLSECICRRKQGQRAAR